MHCLLMFMNPCGIQSSSFRANIDMIIEIIKQKDEKKKNVKCTCGVDTTQDASVDLICSFAIILPLSIGTSKS